MRTSTDRDGTWLKTTQHGWGQDRCSQLPVPSTPLFLPGDAWGPQDFFFLFKIKVQDEMVGYHHRLNGLGFGWTPGVGDGQGGLACYGSWGHKESDMTEQVN